jgi:hypothetical protein
MIMKSKSKRILMLNTILIQIKLWELNHYKKRLPEYIINTYKQYLKESNKSKKIQEIITEYNIKRDDRFKYNFFINNLKRNKISCQITIFQKKNPKKTQNSNH